MLLANFTINCLHHKGLEGRLRNDDGRTTITLWQDDEMIQFDLYEARILMDRIGQAARAVGLAL